MGKLRVPKKKTAVVLSSDDEEEEPITPPKAGVQDVKPQRRQQEEKEDGSRKGAKQAAQPRQSRKQNARETSSSQNSQPSPRKGKEKTIYSFFNAATQKQSLSQPSASPEKRDALAAEIEDDLIQDDDSLDEELAQLSETKFGSKYPMPTRHKRKLDVLDDGGTDSSSLPRGSQIFKRPSTAASRLLTSSGRTPHAIVDQRPWTEKYGPVNMEELAVHKKKVQDVQNWLDAVTSGRDRKRLLILKGAAGTGKTTTVRLLSQELGLNINEWKNPDFSSSGEDGFVSMSAQFEEFVARTGTFGVLDIGQPDHVTKSQPVKSEVGKGVILVEEFPNTFSRSSSALHSFRSAVTQYLETSTPSMDSLFSRQTPSNKAVTPIVMIISETLLSTTTAAADSFTAYRLLGPEILAHSGVSVIEFNPVAMTFMTKALELVIRKEARVSGRRNAPGTSVLKHLAETGDIRSAVSSLEFLCLRGDKEEDWSGRVALTKKKKGGADAPLSRMETESLEMITQRESTLGIFHAVGKAVYNKRELPTDTPPPQPPVHLPQHARSKVSQVDIESLLNELGTDVQTFVAALHENYVLSCQGLEGEETLDHINGCMDSLSDADLLSPDRFSNSHNRLTFQGTGGDSLRQDEISFQTGVRGMLFNLPHPVKRIAPPPNINGIKGKGTGQGPAHQMFYPTSLRLWRRKEEIEALLEMMVTKIQSGQLFGNAAGLSSKSVKPTGIEAWRMNRYREAPKASEKTLASAQGKDEPGYSTTLLGTGSSAKVEMLLETLPYMAMMQKRTSVSTSNSTTLKELEKITKVSLHSKPLDDEDENEDAGPTEQWSTDKPIEDGKGQRGKKKFGLASKMVDQAGLVKGKMESLVLEDDDIEDD
jgi:cell cycle checkpoint protein